MKMEVLEDGDNHERDGEEIPDPNEEECEVDLEGELIFALIYLRAKSKENQRINEKLEDFEIIDLKIQIEEAKRIEYVLSKKIKEKKIDYERLEEEIVSLRKDYEKSMSFGQKFEV